MTLSRIVSLIASGLLVTACAAPQKQEPVAIGKNAVLQTKIDKEGDLLRLNYEGFTLWLDCKERGPVKFRYNAQRDVGNFKRTKSFNYDPNVPRECQQTSTKGYSHGYDRGHQVPANHLDYSRIAIKQTN